MVERSVIVAQILMVDGDTVEMVFFTWASLWNWTEHNAGKYIGVNAEERAINDETRTDDH